MALVTIEQSELSDEVPEAHARAWCERLEAGEILFFPQSPIPFRPEDLSFLLGQQQSGSTLHKNIAYKPNLDTVSGLDAGTTSAADLAHLQAIMRQYSKDVTRFLTRFLSPYQGRWRLDYASFRPQEEEGRDLPLRRRNDLLHTDAFPTRPTRGARILRFFNNIQPHAHPRLGRRRTFFRACAQVCAVRASAPRARQFCDARLALARQHCRTGACHSQPEALSL